MGDKPVPELRERLERAEQALQRCEKLAVASRYAAAVMHEVNNPLEAITNLIYLTKLQALDSTQVIDNMELIQEQLSALAKITNQALTFHRDRGGATPVDVTEIVESALKVHAQRIGLGRVSVAKRFRGPAVASVLKGEILQVLSNLILNSLDALPPYDPHLYIRMSRKGSAVHITIADNGCGMPKEVVEHIFEPHFTTKTHGTGLGLWLSNHIVTKHRGKLRVRTSQNAARRGTTFYIFLPVDQAA